MSFHPNETTIGRILSNNVSYYIPRYQRRYVWNSKNWKNLFDDIILSQNKNSDEQYHFIGSFIFEKDIKKWVVIDGQQRLTTISILLALIAKLFIYYNKKDLFNGIKKYCYFEDDIGDKQLRINNQDFFIFSYIINFCIEDKNFFNIDDYLLDNKIKITKTNKLFYECYQYYFNSINVFLTKFKDNINKIEWLEKLRNSIVNLKAIEITADKEQEGYIIFEILNSRGVPLEQHELLKNYLFMYYPYSVGCDNAKDKWDIILNNVDDINNSSLNRFLTHYITHKFGKVSKNNEYTTLKAKVPKEQVKDFLNDLVDKSNIYRTLSEVNETQYTPVINHVLKFLLDYNNYQFKPVLLSLFEALNKGDLSNSKAEKYLLSIKNFISIYIVVCKSMTNRLESTIYDYALSLHNDFSEQLMDDFINELFKRIDKDKFLTDFSQLNYTNHSKLYPDLKRNSRKECQYILAEYEIYLSLIDDYKITKFTVEHIKPDSQCGKANLIGNLIPLVKRLNAKIKDKPINEKINIYKDSAFLSVKNFIEEYETTNNWDDDEIIKRSNDLANLFFNKIWIKK